MCMYFVLQEGYAGYAVSHLCMAVQQEPFRCSSALWRRCHRFGYLAPGDWASVHSRGFEIISDVWNDILSTDSANLFCCFSLELEDTFGFIGTGNPRTAF